MITVEMSSDIREFEPKVISAFTARQLACIGIGLAYSVPIAVFVPSLETMYRFVLAGVLGAPAFVCGWIKLYGMPLEKFVLAIVIPTLSRPAKRLYKTELAFSNNMEEYASNSTAETKKKKIRYSSKNRPLK